MRKSKYSETEILSIFKEAESGMSGTEIRRMRQLEDENQKL